MYVLLFTYLFLSLSVIKKCQVLQNWLVYVQKNNILTCGDGPAWLHGLACNYKRKRVIDHGIDSTTFSFGLIIRPWQSIFFFQHAWKLHAMQSSAYNQPIFSQFYIQYACLMSYSSLSDEIFVSEKFWYLILTGGDFELGRAKLNS